VAKRGREPEPPRVVVEGVSPEVDGGRWPAKRLRGDTLTLEADVVGDGHGVLAARVCHRGPGDAAWAYSPMTYDYDSDRWAGEVALDRVGVWSFTVEGWADQYETWRDGLEKKVDAGQPVAVELLEGVPLFDAAARRARGAEAETLRQVAGGLTDGSQLEAHRAHAAMTPEVRALMARHWQPPCRTRYDRVLDVVVDVERAGVAAWYELFPRSQAGEPGRHGTFADTARRLPAIAAMGFDVVYLPPIHPIGRTHRKGRNNTLEAKPDDIGSPWAIGNEQGGHTAVDPKLGTLADFDRLVADARALGLEIALDYALQCSPDHPWVREHPDWFFVRPDGTIQYAENPPKKYQDIYPPNFWCEDRRGLWDACRDVFLFWIDHGVHTFRVDNPHTKPFAFWAWVIGEVKRAHPEVVFLAEAFTRPKRMKALAKLGFSQSYTYFTWRNTAAELTEYLTELAHTDMAEYFRPNFFTNTPDILHEYLQTGGRPAFRVRLLLAATLSPLYGIYSGFELCEATPLRPGSEEYLDSEKYQVRVRDWNAPGNLNDDLTLLNAIRRREPALQQLRNLAFHPSENPAILFYHKAAPPGGDDLLIAVNLDPRARQITMVHVPLDDLGIEEHEPFMVEDLLTGARYQWAGVRNYVELDPTRQVGHLLRVVRAGSTAA
jgi:starch synthase (maltosyl-transferring)